MSAAQPTLKKGDTGPQIDWVQNVLVQQGFFSANAIPYQPGVFDDSTEDAVVYFQMTHIGPDGTFLRPVGYIGPRTWWALQNPSGSAQKSGLVFVDTPFEELGITQKRFNLMLHLFAEYKKPVFEVPDGSNSSPDIDKYFNSTGVIRAAWCCAFTSYELHEVLGCLPVDGIWHLGVQTMWHDAEMLGMEVNLPKPGDIFIQIKSGGTGHTGFVVGVSEDYHTIYTIEGNCGNRIKAGARAIETISHFIDVLQDGQDLNFRHGMLCPAEGVANASDR